MTTYKKSTANIILNDEKPQAFPLTTETSQEYPTSPMLFIIILEVLANEIKWEKEVEDILRRKKYNMIVYIEKTDEGIPWWSSG